MSTIAPEWDEYHEKCLVFPRRGGYKRRYQPEPDQTAYIVCYRSAWQDFIAAHLQKLVEEYGIDGVYLDVTSEPWGCRNTLHGCGYKRPDGSIGASFAFPGAGVVKPEAVALGPDGAMHLFDASDASWITR